MTYQQHGRRPFIRRQNRIPESPQKHLIDAIYASQKTMGTVGIEQPIIAEDVVQFDSFSLLPKLYENIQKKGYITTTPIQTKTIPAILEGNDVIGIANTGTGKTAAFLIPLIQKMVNSPQEKVLILTPTRELALQIHQELRDFSVGLFIRSALAVGGMSMERQRFDLKRNPQIVIATPGRLKDFVQNSGYPLRQFNNVVLDEADQMVDIGFIRDINYFITQLPTERQSLFFSATISSKVREILVRFVHNPVTISVKTQEAASTIYQDIIKVVDKNQKVDQLHDVLLKEGVDKVLIFGRTKWGVEKLTKELIRRGFKTGSIHGNKRQSQRQKTLDQFKKNEINILLATDVASRGLDIVGVSHVINYDVPATYDDYIHRIGRTGRANKQGTALTFID